MLFILFLDNLLYNLEFRFDDNFIVVNNLNMKLQ